MKVLVAIDLQNDFITGALGTAEAAAMLPRAERKIREFEGLVLFTRDTHGAGYLSTREGRALPVPHCITAPMAGSLLPHCNLTLSTSLISRPLAARYWASGCAP